MIFSQRRNIGNTPIMRMRCHVVQDPDPENAFSFFSEVLKNFRDTLIFRYAEGAHNLHVHLLKFPYSYPANHLCR